MHLTERGQALIETVAFFLALIGLVVCMLGFTQWFTIRQKLILGAREGAMLYSSGRFKKEEVQKMVRDFLLNGSPTLDPIHLPPITVGPHPNLALAFLQLDYVSVQYTLHSSWITTLGLDPNLEESCTIKHAPQFGIQWQPFYGPPVSWLGNDPLGD